MSRVQRRGVLPGGRGVPLRELRWEGARRQQARVAPRARVDVRGLRGRTGGRDM